MRWCANQSPSAIKDGKIPSFMQLFLFSSLFLSLADRVGREKERMGREVPGRGKLPPDQAIEVRRKEREGRRRKDMLIPEAALCKQEFRLLYRCLSLVSPRQDHKAQTWAGFSSKEGSSPTWFSNIKQRASENTTQPRWLVQGCCAVGCFILNSRGHQPDGQLLPCLPSDADTDCKQSLGWE